MTAVEKLEISLLGLISFDSEELRAKYKERIAKAKETEKQNIINARVTAPLLDTCSINEHIIEAEQYYNETFNK
jgi:hypothetical protein